MFSGMKFRSSKININGKLILVFEREKKYRFNRGMFPRLKFK